MKKPILFLLSLWSVLCFSQINRFAYNYEFKPDSTNSAEIKKETMFLDLSKEGSRFYSHEKQIGDSIAKVEMQKQMASGSRNITVNRKQNTHSIDYEIEKNYPDYKTYLNLNVSRDQYKVASSHQFVWKILPEKQKIDKYEVQKATTTFGGREWIAWFAPELPFQEGPYRFNGLPGMILKLEDTKQEHVFTFSGNRSVAVVEETSQNPNHFGRNRAPIEVNEKQFSKVWKAYKADPAKDMRQMLGQHGVTVRVQSQGREISDPNEMIRTTEKRLKEQLQKNNNPIELDLFK